MCPTMPPQSRCLINISVDEGPGDWNRPGFWAQLFQALLCLPVGATVGWTLFLAVGWTLFSDPQNPAYSNHLGETLPQV